MSILWKKDLRQNKLWKALHSDDGETILAYLEDLAYRIVPTADAAKSQGMIYILRTLKDIYVKSEKECANGNT